MPSPGGVVLRAFVPGAAVAVRASSTTPCRWTCRDAAGFFEGFVAGAALPLAYRLRATRGTETWEFDDPYAFGPTLGPLDDHLLIEGTHARLFDRLGAHPCTHEGVAGVRFAVWAPKARRVSVVGDFNAWDGRRHPMRKRVDSGLWEIFLPGVGGGRALQVRDPRRATACCCPLKADPVGFAAELRPATASIVARTDRFAWADARLDGGARARRDARREPMAIYEVHASVLAPPSGRAFLHWDELADALIPYVVDLGFTHIEFMPVMRASAGCLLGLPAASGCMPSTARHRAAARAWRASSTARMRAGIGVLLDWVPAHFPVDAQGLRALRRRAALRTPRPAARLPAAAGARRSSISAGARSRPSSPPMRCSGSGATTPTGCAWMPSPPCSISTTTARPDGLGAERGWQQRQPRCGRLPPAGQRAGRARDARRAITAAEEASAWPGVTAPRPRTAGSASASSGTWAG